MLAAKSKAGFTEATNLQTPSKTRRNDRNGIAKSDSGSPSPMHKQSSSMPKSRTSVERSSKSVESKNSNKTTTTPDKPPRGSKISEMQMKLDVVEDELKKVREELVSLEREKTKAIAELGEAKTLANEADAKLKEALASRKLAEENSEVERFRADELELASIEAGKREEERQKELESIRNQHALSTMELFSRIEELEKMKVELKDVLREKDTALEERNIALNDAYDAKRTAEIHGQKIVILTTEIKNLKELLNSRIDEIDHVQLELVEAVEEKKIVLEQVVETKKYAEMTEEKVKALSSEVNRLEALLNSKMDMNKEAADVIKMLDDEVNALRLEVERAETTGVKLVEAEASLEQLRLEVASVKKVELEALRLIDEWKKKSMSLEASLEESKESEKSALESLATLLKKLDEDSGQLQDAETEILILTGKVGSLEIEVENYKSELKESDRQLDLAQQEMMSLEKTIELLKSELQKLEVEKIWTLKNEKLSATNTESVLQERQKIMDELNISREEVEQLKKAMEGLTSALHEMSTEVRENQEKFLIKQSELEDAQAKIENLNAALKNVEEKYEVLLDEARYEIVCLKKSFEKFEAEAGNSNTKWNEKEINLVNAIKESETEFSSLTVEMARLMESVKEAEREVEAANTERNEMLSKLQQVEMQAASAHERAEDAGAMSFRTQERLIDKENELQNIMIENSDLRIKQSAAEQKIKDLYALLAETTTKKVEQNGYLSSKVKEELIIHDQSECHETSTPESALERSNLVVSFTALKVHHNDNAQKKGNSIEKEGNSMDFLDIHEAESVNDNSDLKNDGDDNDQMSVISESIGNGANSPTKQHKKKKPLLGKFGNLLKKKGSQK